LEDIKNTLQTQSERHTISRVVRNVRDGEELLKCNAIIEQRFRTFQVMQSPCAIVIVFSRELQLYTLIALRMDSDNTRHKVDMLLEQNSVCHCWSVRKAVFIFPSRDIRNTGIGRSLSRLQGKC
jgi:hypothetical protein